MKKNIVILGGGLVGRVIAHDIRKTEEFNVTIVDGNADTVYRLSIEGFQTERVDFRNESELIQVVQSADVVIGAAPGSLGYKILKTIIVNQKNYVDVSFMPEDYLDLNELASKNNVMAFVDCGVAPGISNLLCGQANYYLDFIEEIIIYVGGLPKLRQQPFEYKVVFSFADVLEEYTRTVVYVENNQLKKIQPLTDIELIDLPKVGTVEAFNTNGLRSLIRTLPLVPNMKEKTLRWPGHAEKMLLLKNGGFLSSTSFNIGGFSISPLEVTTKTLTKQLKLQEDEIDLTVMRVIITGTKDGIYEKRTYDLYDEKDTYSGFHSMARTTGFPCSIVAQMLARNEIKCSPGIIPLEKLGSNLDFTTFFFNELQKRNIFIKETA
jgi:lysine 6-dehydrogenase